MYVYENKAHEACIVLDGVVPKETPDFVIKLDADARQLVVNGTAIDSAISANDETSDEPADGDETPAATGSEDDEVAETEEV